MVFPDWTWISPGYPTTMPSNEGIAIFGVTLLAVLVKKVDFTLFTLPGSASAAVSHVSCETKNGSITRSPRYVNSCWSK